FSISDSDPMRRGFSASGKWAHGEHMVWEASHGNDLVALGAFRAVGARSADREKSGLVCSLAAGRAGGRARTRAPRRALAEDDRSRWPRESWRKSAHRLESTPSNLHRRAALSQRTD